MPDRRAVCGTQRLVAETDTECGVDQRLEGRRRDARRRGRVGSGRDDDSDPVQFPYPVDVYLVVAPDHHLRVGPDVLDEVLDERVVIVDDEDRVDRR
jgi:hypothetical protein